MVLCKTVLQIIFLVLVTSYIDAKHEPKNHKSKNKRQIERLGLYSDSQYVISLTVHTLKPAVYDKNYASLVEVSKKFPCCLQCKLWLSYNRSTREPNYVQLDDNQVSIECGEL